MIASGLSKMRESTSPGRMPPRARQRIWSNSQPDACDLERQPLDQHVVLVPGDVQVFAVVGQHASSAVLSSVASGDAPSATRRRLVRMAQQDRVLAVRAGRDHVDRRADDLLDALEVAARIERQLVPVASTPKVLSVQPGKVS